MALVITNGCSFPKASLMLFCFDKIRDSALNISRSWEYQGYIRVKRIIFCLIHPYFLKYTAYQIKGVNAYSNLFHQFCCIASVLNKWVYHQCNVLWNLVWETRYKKVYLWFSKYLTSLEKNLEIQFPFCGVTWLEVSLNIYYTGKIFLCNGNPSRKQLGPYLFA